MKVWIDQDLCTGDGLCEEIALDVFTLLDDGLAYVKEGDKIFSDPGGAEAAVVPAGQEEATIEAAEECPASASSSRSSSRRRRDGLPHTRQPPVSPHRAEVTAEDGVQLLDGEGVGHPGLVRRTAAAPTT